MATPQEYYLKVINKRFDEDGVYGCQCVDGFKHFCRTVLGYNISKKAICNPTGYATSIWDNFNKLGLNKYFDKVAPNKMVDGDWAIWSMHSKSCPTSHIAMFRKSNGDKGWFLGQNQLGHPEYTQVQIFYSGLRGGLRPKIYHKPAPKPSPASQKNYINIPPSITARNVYNMKKQVIGQIKPKKYGGLSYYVYRYVGDFAEIQTSSFGRVLVKKTASTPITIGKHTYNKGSF